MHSCEGLCGGTTEIEVGSAVHGAELICLGRTSTTTKLPRHFLFSQSIPSHHSVHTPQAPLHPGPVFLPFSEPMFLLFIQYNGWYNTLLYNPFLNKRTEIDPFLREDLAVCLFESRTRPRTEVFFFFFFFKNLPSFGYYVQYSTV